MRTTRWGEVLEQVDRAAVWSDLEAICALGGRFAGTENEALDLGRGEAADFERHAAAIPGRIVLVRHDYMFAAATVHRRRKYAWTSNLKYVLTPADTLDKIRPAELECAARLAATLALRACEAPELALRFSSTPARGGTKGVSR